MEEIKKEKNENWSEKVVLCFVSAVIGAWAWDSYKSVNVEDWLIANQDKLWCGHGPGISGSRARCFVVREFNHPHLDEILAKERAKKLEEHKKK